MTDALLHPLRLSRYLPEVIPDNLPVPRIEVTRTYGKVGGFATKSEPLWQVKAIGLNGQQLPKEDEAMDEKNAMHFAAQWKSLLGWPIVRLRRVVQTQVFIEYEEESNDQ